ncbi:MAG: ParB N-terminal domain-containing protein [Desulforhopalus sp.]
MFLSCRSIPLPAINISSEWNLHPWELQEISTELKQSYEKMGVLHPPIVQESTEGMYRVVNGCKRLNFLKQETSLREMQCMVIEHHASFHHILNLLLTDQSNGRPLTLAEKCRFVKIATRFLDQKTIQKDYLKRLGMKTRPSTIPHMLKLLEQDVRLIKDVHIGRIGEKMMTELLNLPIELDRSVMIQLFRELGMGDGKQRRFFTLLRDNAYRENLTIAAYIERKDIQTILNHDQLNVPQKIHHLSDYLQQQLTPALMQAEDDFTQKVSKMRLPPNHTVAHAQSFEKDEVTLMIKFKNLEECESYLEQGRG